MPARRQGRGGIQVSVRGLEEVRRRVKKLPIRYQKSIMDAITETALVDIETGAKQKLTKDKHIDTGRLRASIHVQKYGDVNFTYSDKLGTAFDGSINKDLEPLEVIVGTNLVYAYKIEKIDSYLFWAFEKARPKLLKRLKRNIRRTPL